MANYDLGTAHGRIEIESDTKGADDADRDLRRLESAAHSLSGAFGKLQGGLSGIGDRMRNASRDSDAFKRGMESATTALAGVARIASGGAGKGLDLLGDSIRKLDVDASTAIPKLYNLKEAIESLGSVSGIIGMIGSHFGDADGFISGLPRWKQQLIGFNGALEAYRWAWASLSKSGAVVGAVGVTTRALGKLNLLMRPMVRNAIAATGAIASLSPVLRVAVNRLESAGVNTARWGAALTRMTPALLNVVSGTAKMVIGHAKMTQGLQYFTKYATASIGAILGMIGASGGIQIIGTAILGIVNAAKQLSGIALLLPGAIAAVGIAAGVTAIAMKGLKEAFKTSTLEGEEFDKALAKLSPEMRSVALASRDLKGDFKELQTIASDTVFRGFGQDMRDIAKEYMPTLRTGIYSVGNALNRVKGGFVDFLKQPATVADIGGMFADTSRIVTNLAKAVWPLGAALRDVAAVGLEAFSDMTEGAGSAAKRFADFISEARKTGQIRAWIDSAIQGFRDLGASVSNLGSMAATVFRAFGADGENALSRMAAATERWRVAVEQSASSGALRAIIDAVQRMAGTSMDLLAEGLKQVGEFLKAIAPLSEQVSETFGHTLLTAITLIGGAFSALLSNLEDFAPVLGFLIGHFLAHAAALKILAFVVAPVIAAFKALFGAYMLFKGAATVFTGITAAVKKSEGVAVAYGRQMGVIGASINKLGQRVPALANMQRQFVIAERAALAFGNTSARTAKSIGLMSAAGSGLRSMASGIVGAFGGATIALMALTTAAIAWGQHSAQVKSYNEQMETSANNARDGVINLVKAFEAAGGVANKDVFAVMVQNLQTFRDDLKATSEETAGVMDNIGASLKDVFSADAFKFGKGANREFNDEMNETARKAAITKKALDDLGMTNEELTATVQGSESAFIAAKQRLLDMGEGGKLAAQQLQEDRTVFLTTAESMARMGPGALAVAEAMHVLGDASSSTADKMDALKSAMEALGLLQVSAVEAAAQVTEAVTQLGESMSVPLGPADQLGTALLNAQGGLAALNPAAQELWHRLEPLSTSLRNTAAAGGDVQGSFAQMVPQLNELRTQANLGEVEWNRLLSTLGLSPREVNILAKLEGTDKVTQDLAGILLQADRVQGTTVDMRVQAKTQEAQDALRNIGFTVEVINATTGEVRITSNAENVDKQISALEQRLGIPIKGPEVLPSDTPPPNPPPPGEMPPVPGPEVKPSPTPPPLPFLGTPPPIAPAPMAPTQTPNPTPPAQIPIVEVPVKMGETPPVNPPPQPDPVQIQVTGVDQVNAQISSIQGPIDGVIAKFGEMSTAFESAMGAMIASASNMAGQVAATLANASSGAYSSGAAVGQGFADGINSKVGAVAAAAGALAAAAAAPLPKSPAEIGPFSGRGWTPYRGKALAEGFAEGIAAGTPGTAMAALDMAKAVDNAMQSLETALKLPVYSQNERYVADMTKTQDELRAENMKRIKEREQEEARSAKREAQQKAKEEAKKTPEERKAEEEKAAKPGGEKKPEDIAKEDREAREKAEQERFDKSYRLLQDGIGTDQEINDGIEDLNKNTTGLTDETKQQVRILSDQDSSLMDQLAALEGIDNSINGYEDIQTQDYLKQIRDSAMQRGGIQEYERPVSTDIPKDVQDTIKNVFDLLDKFEETGKNFMDLVTLLARGFSSTKDIMDAVDHFQSLVSSVMDIAETVGQVVSTVASVAAAFGAMVPGIGQVLAGISAVTGGVSSVNGIVDLIQQGFKIAGRIGGTLLSAIAGGADGMLYGQVRTLIDTNDKTIKRWSEANAMDKRSTSYDVFGNKTGTDNSKKYNFQIYQGPGQDPYRMLDEAMFSMRASESGAYAV